MRQQAFGVYSQNLLHKSKLLGRGVANSTHFKYKIIFRYPKSCIGWCYVMSQGVANDLYYFSLNTPLIHLEDVTFTGRLTSNNSWAKVTGVGLLCLR